MTGHLHIGAARLTGHRLKGRLEADLLADALTPRMEVLNLSHNGLLNALPSEGFTVKGEVKGWGTVRLIVRIMVLGQERVPKGSSC